MHEIITITKELLKFRTTCENKAEFEKIFDYIKEIFHNGFIKEYIFNGKKCIVLSNTEDKKLDVIFCTHIDVVPALDYEIKEDKDNLYGRGTIDMKGATAVCIHLMNTIQTSKKVALFITSDEEIDGNCVKELLNIYSSQFAIVPDGGKNFDFISEEKGTLQLKLSAYGKSAHASQPMNGINAIVKLYEIYNDLLKEFPTPQTENDYLTTVNLSKMIGGESMNSVPSYAEMFLDIRHTSVDPTQKIIQILQKYADVKIEVLLDGEVFVADLNDKYVQKYIETCETVLDHKVSLVGCASTSDAIYFYSKKIPTVIMNPIGNNPHGPNEFVNKESLLTLYKIYFEFLSNL